ncbi:MAG: hypothetical protein AAF146_16070 [Bacteroidota bacterium]
MAHSTLLRRLLWSGQSRWQLWGAFLGAAVGLFLLLFSLQLYQDLQEVLRGTEADGKALVLINKKISLFNTLGMSATFSEAEIETIQSQDFIEEVGQFSSNRYQLSATSQLLGIYTELFFEAVPDRYLDLSVNWAPGDAEVPIILSRDYLALYNFGFAPSRGLPQFTAGTIRRVPFELRLKGRGREARFEARIVGFSDRINSVLVPQSFMDWSNARYGDSPAEAPARLILACTAADDPALERFLAQNNYERSEGKLVGKSFRRLVGSILGVVMGLGILVLVLSSLVVLLHFRLVISQSAADLKRLLEMGYRPRTLKSLLQGALLRFYGGVSAVAALLLVLAESALASRLSAMGYPLDFGIHWTVILSALVLILALLVAPWQNIQQRIDQLFTA